MTSAELQLIGLYTAITAVLRALKAKGVLTEVEIDASLQAVEDAILHDTKIEAAFRDTVLLPVRTLRTMNTSFQSDQHPPDDDLLQRLTGKKPE